MVRIAPKSAVATVFVAAMFINIIDATVVNVALLRLARSVQQLVIFRILQGIGGRDEHATAASSADRQVPADDVSQV